MKNRKTTRSAVFASFTALLLCASMLIATTFAWFTDSVTSSGNIIKSGTLDVEMSWADGTKAVPADDSTDWTDASTGAIFNYDLWEPGYTEVRHIRVANVGTLALKYQLQIKANDVVSALAEAIDVYFLDPAQQIADRAALPAASLVGTLDDVLSGGIAKASGSLGASDDVELTIALKMQEDAGNEYQDLAIGSDFSVTLLATQMTAETDSFDNQYDAESGWDGSVPTAMPETLVVDTANKVISINDTAALVYLNTLVNDPNFSTTYGSKWQYTVELNADVNLMGKPWTPMVLSNFVAFEGNGHTIRNLSVNTSGKAGLFSEINCDDIGITYIRNLNVDGAYVQGGDCVGVIAGYNPQGVMENVTVNNATVIGNKYVGGIYGHGNGAVTGSAVKNSTITIPAGG
ncbi:MAG: SipW-dependent-type signal peptide-containing protein, partial [Oscillospiraceae bacterium]|nr:SipW-dependent-type signal peptide-containing protein [Oscillospiraceae bacterium]